MRYTTLSSLKTYNRIIVKFKTIKYKIDIAYYISFLPLTLTIKLTH